MSEQQYSLPFFYVPVRKQNLVFDGEVFSYYFCSTITSCVILQQLIPRHFYNKVVLLSDSKAARQAIGSYEAPSSKNIELLKD
ncbi:hypothetical protein CDAR_596081 [Caerostris darwini]|uniref:Uncharacterized protein n=1 Tax=Caerostris darwini TaxID=1538125 RepID=A0AAV4WYS9_9ARAC|nr:hypothetical protein CDAR_596081 [Caerostris darwini]